MSDLTAEKAQKGAFPCGKPEKRPIGGAGKEPSLSLGGSVEKGR